MAYVKNYPGGWQNGAGGGTPIDKTVLDHMETQYDEANTIVLKAADETVNNSAVLQDDDHLLFPVGANEVWEFETYLRMISASATPAFRFQFTVPAAGALDLFGYDNVGPLVAQGVITPIGASTVFLLVSAAALRVMVLKGLYVGGANAGNVQLQWAQGSATVEDTKLLTNSFIIAHKLN